MCHAEPDLVRAAVRACNLHLERAYDISQLGYSCYMTDAIARGAHSRDCHDVWCRGSSKTTRGRATTVERPRANAMPAFP